MRWWRPAVCVCLALAGASVPAAARVAAHPPAPPRTTAPTGEASALHAAPPRTIAPSGEASALHAAPASVRESPFGLSIEYPLLEQMLGTGTCPGEALIHTWRELGSPALRIGGDSQDLAGPTAAYHYLIPPTFWSAVGCLARATGSQITAGLNFADATLEDQLATIAAAKGAIPAGQLSFSLGNEPDLYEISHIIPNDPGFIVPAFRSPPWSAGAYASEWTTRRAQLGAIRLEGPDLAGTSWRQTIIGMLRADPPSQVDAHGYPTVACGSAGAPATPARLLSKHASVGLVEKLSWLAQTARAIHRPAVISETNSASCGGKPGVSDTPVAGVWAARYVVAALLAGFSQVRFHTAGTSYDAIDPLADGTIAIRPLGGALLFLHRWIPLGSRLTPLSRGPRVLAVEVADGARASTIVSSFSPKPVPFTVAVPGAAGRVRTHTLTTASATEVAASVAVYRHQARLVLPPNTVVAVRTH
jgi:hypothetical protein